MSVWEAGKAKSMKRLAAQLSQIKIILGIIYVLFLITPLFFSSTNALASALGEIAGFCPQCGTPVEPGSAFCGNCGAKLQ
jgi:hypothetical protein